MLSQKARFIAGVSAFREFHYKRSRTAAACVARTPYHTPIERVRPSKSGPGLCTSGYFCEECTPHHSDKLKGGGIRSRREAASGGRQRWSSSQIQKTLCSSYCFSLRCRLLYTLMLVTIRIPNCVSRVVLITTTSGFRTLFPYVFWFLWKRDALPIGS